MKKLQFAIFDKCAVSYMTPFSANNVMEAQRAFNSYCMEDGSPPNKFPHDFDLYLLGEFETDTGKLTQTKQQPTWITSALHAKQKDAPLLDEIFEENENS